MRIYSVSVPAVLLGCVLAAGCEKKAPPIAEVEGAVKYDNEPVAMGMIAFITPEGQSSAGGAVINGKYRILPESGLRPGKYRVEIKWSKPTGEKKPDAGYGQDPNVYVEAIPEKYNKESTLTAEVKAGPNKVDFILEK